MNKCLQNVAKLSMGCRIIEQSKNIPEYSAIHIISENHSKNGLQQCWRSPTQNPYCIIDLSNISQRPKYLNTIAFYHNTCHTACASLIEVCHKQRLSDQWVVLGVFSLQQVAGWQSFSFKAVAQNQMNFLSLHLCDNFDDGKDVTLSKFALGFQKQPQIQQLCREMEEMRLQNQLMKERLYIQERECANMKDLFQKMEKQIKSIVLSTDSSSSDDFVKLNDSIDDKDPLSKDEQTREIAHQQFDLLH